MSGTLAKGWSLTVKDTDGGGSVDLSTYGLVVLPGGRWPLSPEPQSDTVNLPHAEGGYTYVGQSLPGVFSLRCMLIPVNGMTLMAAIAGVMGALPTDQRMRIYLDALPAYYWVGVRISGITQAPHTRSALGPFDIQIALDDPEPKAVTP